MASGVEAFSVEGTGSIPELRCSVSCPDLLFMFPLQGHGCLPSKLPSNIMNTLSPKKTCLTINQGFSNVICTAIWAGHVLILIVNNSKNNYMFPVRRLGVYCNHLMITI